MRLSIVWSELLLVWHAAVTTWLVLVLNLLPPVSQRLIVVTLPFFLPPFPLATSEKSLTSCMNKLRLRCAHYQTVCVCVRVCACDCDECTLHDHHFIMHSCNWIFLLWQRPPDPQANLQKRKTQLCLFSSVGVHVCVSVSVERNHIRVPFFSLRILARWH